MERRIERELWQRILPHVYRERRPLALEAWHVPGEPVSHEHALAQTFEPFALGGAWGPPWGTTWFRLRGDVPADWVGPHLEAVVDLGWGMRGPGFQAEGLVVDLQQWCKQAESSGIDALAEFSMKLRAARA